MPIRPGGPGNGPIASTNWASEGWRWHTPRALGPPAAAAWPRYEDAGPVSPSAVVRKASRLSCRRAFCAHVSIRSSFLQGVMSSNITLEKDGRQAG
jgi:hypothetical protein